MSSTADHRGSYLLPGSLAMITGIRPYARYHYIDGHLHGYNPGALQELVIICIYEEHVAQEFAPPQELPISTTRVHVIQLNAIVA